MAGDPMRIATGLHSPQLGGSQITTIQLAKRLRERGHEVEMFVIDQEFKASALPLAAEAGFEVEVFPGESNLTAQAAHIKRFIERHDSQVTHVYHEHHWLGALLAIALRSLPGRAGVVTNWMMENHRWIPPYLPLIVGFDSIRDEAEDLQRGPVWLIEPPVDTDRDAPDPARGTRFRVDHDLDPDAVVAVVVTRVDRDMKLDSILRSIAAAEQIDDDRFRLVVVGDGDAMDDVRSRAAAANTAAGRTLVQLTGSLQDPRPAYDAADVVIGMGGSALRGLAFAKPLIVVGAGSFSEIFGPDTLPIFRRDGFYGHDEGDEAGTRLAEQIRSLFDPGRRAELGAYGRKTVEERYSLDVMTERLEQVYRAAIDDPPNLWERTVDAGWVYGYDLSHRFMPTGLKQSIRQRVPRLRTA